MFIKEPSPNAVPSFNLLKEYFLWLEIDVDAYAKQDILSYQDRKKFVNVSADFCVRKFGILPKTEQKIEVAKELIALFPQLKYQKSEEGYVSNIS